MSARLGRLLRVALLLASTGALGQPLVVVDPGHGGKQEGAKSPDGHHEKDVVLAIAKVLKAELEKSLGATVRLTRTKDALVHLSERVEQANDEKPDLFLSLHLNSMPTQRLRKSTAGIETYFLSAFASGEQAKKVAARENAEALSAKGPSGDTLAFILADLQRSETLHDSSRLAYAVHEALVQDSGAQDRGVQQAPFYVLMGLEAPAILLELGFLSHPDESQQLVDPEYQRTLAKAVARGVSKFLATVSTRDAKKGEGAREKVP